MRRIYKLPTWSLIRIYNYIENEKGYGDQIIQNSDSELLDMKENFGWDNLDSLMENSNYNPELKFIHCGFNELKSIPEDDISGYVCMVLDDTPSGDILEIIQEEYEVNGLGKVIL